MPAWTADNGENYADEISYKLWKPLSEAWVNISLDQAQGKVITMTEVYPHGKRIGIMGMAHVTIYVKSPEDVGLEKSSEISEMRDLVEAGKEDRVEIDSLVDEVIKLEKKIHHLRRTIHSEERDR